MFSRTGGPEVLERQEVDAAMAPGPNQVRVRHLAVGVNFIDIYFRSGTNPVSSLPSGIGLEAVGVVEAVGDSVDFIRPGDRVGYATGELGAYSTVRVMAADLLVPVPDWVDPEVAAALLVKGMTTEVLVTRCAKVEPGQIALVHAASGGVGSILVQWLKSVGAFVIAHAGSEEKAERAKSLGADEGLFCSYADLPDEVRRVTGKHRADVVFESVGAASWAASMKSVAKRGLIVSFGNASGRPPEISTRQLSEAGSIFVTRPNMFHYNDTRERKCDGAARVFDMLREGKLHVDIGQRFPLSAAQDAHRALESRQTVGSTVLHMDG